MTDKQMDARLQGAAERWRARNTAVAQVDLTDAALAGSIVDVSPSAQPPRPGRRAARIWAIAASVVLVLGAAAVLVTQLADTSRRPAAAESGTADLIGKDWTLSTMTGAGGRAVPVVAAAGLKFDAHSVGGTDACNHIGGAVTVHDTQIELGGLAMTDMACVNRADGFDAELALIHEVLSGTVRWSVSVDELTLTKPGKGTLVYREVKHTTATDPKALVGPIWELSGIEHDTGNSRSATGSSDMANTTVTFDSTGHSTISHRCYVTGADVRIGAGTLDIGKVTMTGAIPCPTAADQRAEQQRDSAVDGVLTGHVTWSVHDTDLTVTKGATTLDFSAKQ